MESRPDSLPEGALTTGKIPFAPEPFGKYYLLDRVAVGGMAEVFLAKTFGHAGFEKLLVVKRILSRFADDPAFVAMFVDEAKLTVSLLHPNVVQIHDFGKQGPHWFIAMEAVHGKDLKSVMRRLAERGERMPLELAAVIAHETVRGLGYAHTRLDPAGQPLRIVHRDVSPSNVLISYEGTVKLVDFGIAKAETTRDESSEQHLLKGKFQYMSPEQTRGGELDHRSDVFAAGICLWEMLTGHRLFKRESDYEVVEAIRGGQVPLPSAYNPAVPPHLEAICLRALEVDLARRYPDAAAMQRDLQDYLLPSTPERLQPTMSTFLTDLFVVERAEERAQLERATKFASELHYGGDDLELDDEIAPSIGVPPPSPHATQGSGTLRPPEPSRKRGAAATLRWLLPLIVVVGLGGFALRFLGPTEAPPPPPVATVLVEVLPADAPNLRLLLDGQPITSRQEGIAAGVPHELTITADGFAPRSKTLELVAGQVFSTEIVLTPVPTLEEPTPTPRATPTEARLDPDTPGPVGALEPPTVSFRSEPEGAKVFVDGSPIGVTPLNWEAGPEGTAYNVEFRMSGYASVQAVVDAPPPGERRRLSRTLEPKGEGAVDAVSTEPGKLSVQVSSGWAKIYVDGAYVDTTPLSEHSIAPGTYAIRVVNERTGLDVVETVTIKPGEVARKTFRVAE